MARLEPGDVSEDQAAAEIAAAVRGRGRARRPRLHRPLQSVCRNAPACWWSTRDAIDRLNRIDEAITLATLPAFKPVVEGEMIATVKIIPFAVAARRARRGAGARRRKAKPVIRVAPYTVRKVGVVSTLLPGLAPKVIEKTLEDHRGAHRAGRRDASSPSGACRTSRPRSPSAIDEVLQERRRTGHRVRRLGDRRPPRRHPGRASKRSAARSSISACRSIPAI